MGNADRYDDVGGAKDALEKLREVVELPLLHPERFITLGIDPPKGVLLYGPRKSHFIFTTSVARRMLTVALHPLL